MPQNERGLYEPGDDMRVYDASEEDEDVEGSRLPLLIVLALLVLAMFAGFVWLAYSAAHDATGFGQSPGLDMLLLAAGIVTALPLLMFAAAARRLPLSTMGLLQYIAPSLQFGLALLFGEPLRPVHFVTFPLIWAGCALYAWDSVRAVRAPMPEDIKPAG